MKRHVIKSQLHNCPVCLLINVLSFFCVARFQLLDFCASQFLDAWDRSSCDYKAEASKDRCSNFMDHIRLYLLPRIKNTTLGVEQTATNESNPGGGWGGGCSRNSPWCLENKCEALHGDSGRPETMVLRSRTQEPWRDLRDFVVFLILPLNFTVSLI